MSEIDIKTYVRARGRVKGSITKIENFVNSIENEVVDYEKVNMRFKQLDVLLAEFVKYDDIVGDIEGHDYEFDEIEAKVIKLKDKLLDIQKELCDDKNSKQMNVAKGEEVSGIGEAELSKVLSMLSENQRQLIVSTTENQNVVSASLPKINIKSFNGEYCEWPTFKDNFTKLIHENRRLSKIEKFVQLKNFLGPKPLLLIQNLIVTNENYDSAWQKLNKRYDNGRKIANSYLDLFFNQKIVRDGTAEEIRCISDTTESILNGLDSLGDNVQNRDIWLIYILLMKLDDKTKQLWAEKQTIIFGDNNLTQINSSFPTIAEFLKFLDERRSALETIQDQEYNKKSLRNNKISTHFIHNSVFSCNICKSNHPIYKCSKFQTLNSQERKDYVIKNKLCFNCLSNGHSVKTCKSHKRCLSCNGKHHTSIHLKKLNVANDEIQDKTNQTFIPRFPTSNNICFPSQQSNDSSNQKVFSCNVTNLNTTILPTAQVLATHPNGYIYSRCNVLLDSGSQVTFISEALAQQLKLKREQIKLTVGGLSSTGIVHTNGATKLKLRSVHNKEEITIRAHILKNIASKVPETTIDVSKWPCSSQLKLADEQFGVSKKIDILLGADYFFNVLKEGQIEERHHPCLKNTIFGWVVVGTYNRETAEAQTFTVTVEDNKDIENSLERFWKLESVVETTQTSQMSHFCETHFEENTITDKEGKFVVALPFVEGMSELGDSMDIAISKFYSLERRLQNNTELYEQYREFLEEYEQLGHMQQITANEIRVDSKKSYYFPHHAVERPEKTTTKVRVVFNGSSKTKNGISLNQILAVGPTVQRDIQTILINFRWHKIVLVGDIEKMYRQVLVRESDCNYQRIVWRDNPDLPLRHYKLCTVTYGTTCAPFLATRCLMEVGIKNQELFPIAAKAIINDFYVDDFISGADDIQKALELQKQVTHLLAERNFKLRKWKSNSVNILRQISHNTKTELIDLNGTSKHCNSTKVLGLHWDSEEDFFTYRVNLDSNFKITKRNILSESSKIFDPLGFISPCTIAIKIIFQQLWIKKVDWDEDLPLDIQNQWKKLRQQFKKFEDIKIQRWIQTPNSEIELIGFCDASEAAYSAVIYIKTTSNNKISNVKLLTAKSKVAPLKRLTIPRLELCGASLLTKLYSFVCSSLQLSNVNMTAFTDSSVVLSWLNSQPNQWKPYVANRVSNIIEILPGHKWKHVSTNSNPADCASRGISVDKLLEHTLWWHGPSWLTKEASEWPFSSGNTNKDQAEKELRKNVLQTFYYQNTNDTLNFLFDKISSITKILRIISYCLRITGKWKLQTAHTPFLQSDELEHSLRICIAWAQKKQFS